MGEKELNLDSFGEIVDEFIRINHVQMLIDLPEGTMDPVLKDNTGLGVAVQFYILLAALGKAIEELMSRGLDPGEKEGFVDKVLQLVKDSVMEDVGKEGKSDTA